MHASKRFVVLGVALVAIACNRQTSAPTAPTQSTASGQSVASPRAVTLPPSNTAPQAPTGAATVSGFVTEAASPVAGANVNAWVDTGTFGYSYMWAHGPILTDAAGQYRLTGLPGQARVWLQTYKSGYVQQCAAPQLTIGAEGDTRVDVQLVAQSKLSDSGAQPSPAGFRSVSGVIFENADGGRKPIAGAFIDFEPTMDFPAATTFSGADGRYLLCGIPEEKSADIGVGFRGRVTYVTVPPGHDAAIDILLP
jgi:hypothetical protein